MMREYLYVPRKTCNEDCEYTAYDIVYAPGGAAVRDVTSDRECAEYIVRLLNRCRVSPIHLQDVVEDCLCEM